MTDLRQALDYVRNGVMSINEARAFLGKEPWDMPGCDERVSDYLPDNWLELIDDSDQS
jgi:hypothetical protein